jgi:hypothetical protein
LAERLDEIFLERSCGVPEESYARDFSWLLRLNGDSNGEHCSCKQD